MYRAFIIFYLLATIALRLWFQLLLFAQCLRLGKKQHLLPIAEFITSS
jgi:hypothetical protein